MKKIIEIRQHDPELMHLTWMINNICPNSCSYCPSDLHNGKNHHYDWDNARRFFQYLFERYPKLHCSVSGGEASVSPFFEEIVQTFKDAGHTIGATSNAAKPVHYWQRISKNINYICFSYHPEFPDKNFVEKVTEAAKNTSVTVRIMMHPNHWDHCLEMFNTLDQYDYFFTEPVRILNWGASDTAHIYTPDQSFWFAKFRRSNKNTEHLTGHVFPKILADVVFEGGVVDHSPNIVDYINSGSTNFFGYQCDIGLKSMFIDQLGRVFLANCLINGPIGNINDPENIQWPSKPVICTKKLCHCSTDVNINKRII